MKSRPIPEAIRNRIHGLPERPGVYLFKDLRGNFIYIGKALSIRKRVTSHFRHTGEGFSKQGRMLDEIRSIDFIETPTESDALLLEASLVKENRPWFNQELKDDKSYPFLKITSEKFPRLLIVRGRRSDGGKYFGPYTSGKLLKQAVKMLRRLFPMRTCNPVPDKVCLMYHIGQCKGPCVGEIGESGYAEIVRDLEHFLEGRRDVLVKSLSKRMKEYSANREYEKAKVVYEEMKALANVRKSVRTHHDDARVLEEMKNALALPKLPERIEGFDISNISGREAVGSMVVCLHGEPSRKDYRHFRIKTVTGIDDYRMMREVVRRRYTRLLAEKTPLPDLVMIDGGKGHLAAAKKELDGLGLRDLPIISIAKQHEHIFSPHREGPHIFPQGSPILQMIQRLRDEAHRFAITHHRKLHKKESLVSLLDGIPGVGPKTKERLLKKVGLVGRIKTLTEEQLSEKAGIRPEIARNILDILRKS